MAGNAESLASKVSEGWAAQISGKEPDIWAWKSLLKPPFEPWVEDYVTEGETRLLLRSAKWKELKDGDEVRREAETLVERLNGALVLVHNDATNLRVEDVYEFDENAKRIPRIVTAAGHISAKARVRASLEKVGEPRTASFVQDAVASADGDDKKAELLGHFSRASNWYELYKAIECIQALNPDVKTKKWEEIRQTANHYRHHRSKKSELPANPPTFEQARLTVLAIGKTAL